MRRAVCLLVGALLVIVVAGSVPARPLHAGNGALRESSTPSVSSAETIAVLPDWLEPRGLNIVDLVGWVPESDLIGAMIQYTPGYGILRYKSGSRVGNTVSITATAYPRFYSDSYWSGSLFGCLGQGARIDELGTVAPASTLRVYTPNGQEITEQVDGYYYVPAGLTKPIRNPRESESANLYRYWETGYLRTSLAADGALLLPANMGCELLVSYRDYRELTLVFTVETTPAVWVEVLGRQSFQFPVYTGPGFAGHFDALRNQLAGACTAKPPVVADMVIPPGTDYFLFNFPPVPVDPYTAFHHNPLGNIDRPTGATYRLRTPRGPSADHVISAGLPLFGHWVDMDLAPDAQWLPYSKQVMEFEGLEPLVPAGIRYDSCMVTGNCSAAKLQEICSTAMPGRMIYLRVERVQTGLSRIPLQMPGPAWRAASATASQEGPAQGSAETVAGGRAAAASATPVLSRKVYLPWIPYRTRPSVEPDDPTGCSVYGGCGWFTSDGRMVDYIPAP